MLIALVIVVVTCGRCQAAISPGVIHITVVDRQTGKEISDAEVDVLGGSVPLTAFTDEQGRLELDDVDPGLYTVRVSRRGYESASAIQLEVLEAHEVAISIALTPEQVLRTIASVTAQASISISSREIDPNSPERRVSSSLLDAMQNIAGVNVDDTAFGTAFSSGISLRGQSALATGYGVNGAPVGSGASNINLAQDLFTGADVTFSPSFGYLGGFISYSTLHPTRTWTYKLRASLGNYGASAYSASATGSYGKVGVAIQQVGRGADSFLSGASFRDQSGLFYSHDGGIMRLGDSLELRYNAGPRTTLTYDRVAANEASAALCTLHLTLLPCGVGPGNGTDQGYSMSMLNANSFVGKLQTSLMWLESTSSTDLDERRRKFDLIDAPYSLNSLYKNTSLAATLSTVLGRHTLSIQMRGFGTHGTVTQSLESGFWSRPVSQTSGMVSVQDNIRANDKLTINVQTELNSSSVGGTGPALAVSSTWLMNRSDTLMASLSGGRQAPSVVPQVPLADPTNATFDCANGATLVNGPSDPGTSVSQRSASIAILHKWRISYARFEAGIQSATGEQRALLVPISAEPSSLFPGGLGSYMGDLQSTWQYPTICGISQFDPSRVYLQQYVSGLAQRLAYVSLNGRVSLGRSVILLPSIQLNHSSFTRMDSRFASPNSIYQVGKQIPEVPEAAASLTVDALANRWEYLLNARFQAANNQNNLPPYGLVNVGAVLSTKRGKLTFLVSNLFNTEVGEFTQYLGVNPFPLVGGGQLAFPSTPLSPRQWSVMFEPRLGAAK